jgi:hypothetical protein
MAQSQWKYLSTQPAMLELGAHFVGATLRGSLQVLGATSCSAYHAPE